MAETLNTENNFDYKNAKIELKNGNIEKAFVGLEGNIKNTIEGSEKLNSDNFRIAEFIKDVQEGEEGKKITTGLNNIFKIQLLKENLA